LSVLAFTPSPFALGGLALIAGRCAFGALDATERTRATACLLLSVLFAGALHMLSFDGQHGLARWWRAEATKKVQTTTTTWLVELSGDFGVGARFLTLPVLETLPLPQNLSTIDHRLVAAEESFGGTRVEVVAFGSKISSTTIDEDHRALRNAALAHLGFSDELRAVAATSFGNRMYEAPARGTLVIEAPNAIVAVSRRDAIGRPRALLRDRAVRAWLDAVQVFDGVKSRPWLNDAELWRAGGASSWLHAFVLDAWNTQLGEAQ
jgi:hypothetical protein